MLILEGMRKNMNIYLVMEISQISSELSMTTDHIQLTLIVVIKSKLLLSNFYQLGEGTKLFSFLNSLKTVTEQCSFTIIFPFMSNI